MVCLLVCLFVCVFACLSVALHSSIVARTCSPCSKWAPSKPWPMSAYNMAVDVHTSLKGIILLVASAAGSSAHVECTTATTTANTLVAAHVCGPHLRLQNPRSTYHRSFRGKENWAADALSLRSVTGIRTANHSSTGGGQTGTVKNIRSSMLGSTSTMISMAVQMARSSPRSSESLSNRKFKQIYCHSFSGACSSSMSFW